MRTQVSILVNYKNLIKMGIFDNFMEDALYHQQLKQEYEYRMWVAFVEEEEAKEKEMIQYFKDLETYENTRMEKEYRNLLEWDLINN
jgi:hypothetical protein